MIPHLSRFIFCSHMRILWTHGITATAIQLSAINIWWNTKTFLILGAFNFRWATSSNLVSLPPKFFWYNWFPITSDKITFLNNISVFIQNIFLDRFYFCKNLFLSNCINNFWLEAIKQSRHHFDAIQCVNKGQKRTSVRFFFYFRTDVDYLYRFIKF